MKKIILASGSPRRKELLDQMGIAYEVIVSDIDEDAVGDMSPPELVQVLANMKAKAVVNDLPDSQKDAIVIGADTIVVLDHQILGKPNDALDAEKMLSLLSGKMHIVYTGVSVVNSTDHKEETFVQSSKIYMKHMSKEEIKDYVLTKEPLDKAGSYGIQGKGGVFVEKIEGDYFSVMGLPIAKLYESLKNFR